MVCEPRKQHRATNLGDLVLAADRVPSRAEIDRIGIGSARQEE
jgi:hypothetical protein